MSSPAEIPYNSFIEIDRFSETAIYLQLANQLAKAIQLGYRLNIERHDFNDAILPVKSLFP